MKQVLDPAFARHIPFVVQFPFPDAAQRAEIRRQKAHLQTLLKAAYVYRDNHIELEFRD